MRMLNERLLISTVAPDAAETARLYSLGLEIAEYCTAWNMDDEFPETHAAVEKKVAGISRRALHAPFNELFPCAIDKKARALAAERYRQAVELAVFYGADRVIIHGGYNAHMYYPVWYTEQSVVFWREFMKTVPEGIKICLENVFEPEPGMLADIIRMTDSPGLGMCLDVGHVNAYSKIPALKWLEDCRDVISHYHIHNNAGDADTHCGPAEGTIPMKELICAAERLTPEATLSLEVLSAAEAAKWLEENGFIQTEGRKKI